MDGPSMPRDFRARAERPADPAVTPELPGLLVWQVATQWQREVRPLLDGLDLTHAQFALLRAAVGCGGADRHAAPVTQAQIAEAAHTDPVMTSEVLRTLEGKGLVVRRAHPEDARARRILVTAKGAALAKRAMVAVARCDERYFASGNPELKALARALKGGRGR
jgi:DNA-binding MarR family transcriptional regulator